MTALLQYSAVRLKEAMPDWGLPAGITGTVVEVFSEPQEGYEVEFDEPYNQATYTLRLEDLQLVESEA